MFAGCAARSPREVRILRGKKNAMVSVVWPLQPLVTTSCIVPAADIHNPLVPVTAAWIDKSIAAEPC